MTYSVNPFKWLLWLCRKIRWRKSPFQAYHCPKPLSKKGKAEKDKRFAVLIKGIVEGHNRRRAERMRRDKLGLCFDCGKPLNNRIFLCDKGDPC